MTEYKLQLAEFFLRTFTGIIFLFQGYDKLFRIKMPGVIQVFTADADKFHIPKPLLSVIAWYTGIAEFVGGLFLLVGFFTTYALYALGLDLLLVAFAFSYMEPLWNMKHVFPRLLLIVTLLILPEAYSTICLDHFLNLK